MAGYEKRKQLFIERIKKIITYVRLEKPCRSQYIADYFERQQIKPCGICDNCLQQKNHGLSNAEFDNIAQSIFTVINQHPLPGELLQQQLPGIKQEKLFKVLDFCRSENKLFVDKDGYVRPANKKGEPS